MKRRKKSARKPRQKVVPKTYLAWIDKRGRRVKSGTRGARRIHVTIAREKLSVAAKKIAARKQAVKSKRQLAAKKAAATRKAKRSGASFVGERITRVARYRYRDYIIPDFHPDNIRPLIERELLTSKDGLMSGSIAYYDRDGEYHVTGTRHLLTKISNAELLAAELEELTVQYEMEEIDEIGISFTFAKETA